VTERSEELLDELVRLVAYALRRDLENQAEAIRAFREVGLEPGRIAELLGTTAATVRGTKPASGSKAKAGS
jgi:hypothetical protein